LNLTDMASWGKQGGGGGAICAKSNVLVIGRWQTVPSKLRKKRKGEPQALTKGEAESYRFRGKLHRGGPGREGTPS